MGPYKQANAKQHAQQWKLEKGQEKDLPVHPARAAGSQPLFHDGNRIDCRFVRVHFARCRDGLCDKRIRSEVTPCDT